MRFYLHAEATKMFISGWPKFFHKNRNCHESSPRKSCEPLDRTILHRISVRTTLWRRHFSGSGSTFGPRNRALRHKNRNCHESSPRESCEPLDRTILHRISARTFSWQRHFLKSWPSGSGVRVSGSGIGCLFYMRVAAIPCIKHFLLKLAYHRSTGALAARCYV